MCTVVLSSKQVSDARFLAKETFARYKNVRGHYTNTLRAHEVAKLGEVAAETWLIRCVPCGQVDPAFRDISREKECDIVIKVGGRVTRVEVKTWSRLFWKELGRCIAVDQSTALQAKADVVLRCVLDPDGRQVVIEGWNCVFDLDCLQPVSTGPPNGRKVWNRQVPLSGMREPGDLGTLLS